ncbi:MAG: hypothetical protein OJF49_000094 [Ktedonobacterales bacterium]|nr:MAG: hypothetical protein OJF49_000094 [Ktedonobacterales bacterium]
MAEYPIPLFELNTLDQADFTRVLEPLFEGPPWIVERAWLERPFDTREVLYQAVCTIMYAASLDEQLALLRAHPDLVGRAALAGTLSGASTGEQSAAGLDRLTPDDIALFTRENAAYRATFGFPFIICAREHTKSSILTAFAERLPHTREQEMETALAEVAKICALRLRDLVRQEGEE